MLHIAEFLLIRGLFLIFLFHLIQLLFGRALASVSPVAMIDMQKRLIFLIR